MLFSGTSSNSSGGGGAALSASGAGGGPGSASAGTTSVGGGPGRGRGGGGDERPTANWYSPPTDLLFNIHVLHRDAQLPLSESGLFGTQILILVHSLVNILIALLVLVDVSINSYIFIIVSSVVVAVLIVTFQYNILWWAKAGDCSHTHNNEVFIGYFMWVFISLSTCILLAVWLSDKQSGSCCSLTDSLPVVDLMSPVEVISYYCIYAYILVGFSLAAYCNVRSCVAHVFPEQKFVDNEYIESVNNFMTNLEQNMGGGGGGDLRRG